MTVLLQWQVGKIGVQARTWRNILIGTRYFVKVGKLYIQCLSYLPYQQLSFVLSAIHTDKCFFKAHSIPPHYPQLLFAPAVGAIRGQGRNHCHGVKMRFFPFFSERGGEETGWTSR